MKFASAAQENHDHGTDMTYVVPDRLNDHAKRGARR